MSMGIPQPQLFLWEITWAEADDCVGQAMALHAQLEQQLPVRRSTNLLRLVYTFIHIYIYISLSLSVCVCVCVFAYLILH